MAKKRAEQEGTAAVADPPAETPGATAETDTGQENKQEQPAAGDGAQTKQAEQAQRAEEDPAKLAERATNFLSQHLERHTAALERVRVVAITTSSTAWKENYSAQQAAHDKLVREKADLIIERATTLKREGSEEDDEKAIRDAAKAITEEREGFEAWSARQIAPFIADVNKCTAIRDEAIQAVQRVAEQPLFAGGLGAELRARVKAWPVVKWNAKTGEVLIGTAEELAAMDADAPAAGEQEESDGPGESAEGAEGGD